MKAKDTFIEYEYFLFDSSGMDECTADVVEIHGTDPATMEIIIKYMYSSKIELDTTNVQNLVQVWLLRIRII